MRCLVCLHEVQAMRGVQNMRVTQSCEYYVHESYTFRREVLKPDSTTAKFVFEFAHFFRFRRE